MSAVDQLIGHVDRAFRTSGVNTYFPDQKTLENFPASSDAFLTEMERRRVARLMRINHAGEICAQALYHGQSSVARNKDVKVSLDLASTEEGAHLAWTGQSVNWLKSKNSLLDPFCYAGSYVMGAVVGMAGDRASMSFLAETELMVESHLDSHIRQIPKGDACTLAILERMKCDERGHAEEARHRGAISLPVPVSVLMKAASMAMICVAYWI